MKNLFKTVFTLLILITIGSYSKVSAQSYMDRANAEITITKVIEGLEAVYGQVDRHSEKPYKPNRHAPDSPNRGYDLAKMKYGNLMLKVLRKSQSVESALSEASSQYVSGSRREVFLKTEEFYKKLLSI